jgi:hypothetical protein
MKDEILEELWRVKDQIADETKGNTQTPFERTESATVRAGDGAIPKARESQR